MTSSEQKDRQPRIEVPDAFLSHSSADKNLFVRPLAECLADQGATVWYDEYSMRPGDSLSASIDDGLSKARCGLIVLSPRFIRTARDSGWTRYELRGIVSNSIGPNGRRIIPIWMNVTADEVREFSPPLADLLAIDATGKHIEEVALDVLRVIAPDRANGLERMRLLYEADGQRVETVPLSSLRQSPIVDRRVGGHVALRALLVTQALADCGMPDFIDYQDFLENLARDLHHERELRHWEAIACSYALACSTYDLDQDKRHALFRLLFTATLGDIDSDAIAVVTGEVAGPVLEHFQRCLELAQREIVIGQGGLRGIVRDGGSADPPSPGDAGDDETE